MKRIQNRLHRIGTYDVCKISLSCFDDKRYVLDNGVNSLVYFHKDIKIDNTFVCFHKIDKSIIRLIKDS